MECVEGRVFWDQSLPGTAPGDRAAIYEECAKIAEDYAQAADLQNQSGHVRAALNITDAILERKSQ